MGPWKVVQGTVRLLYGRLYFGKKKGWFLWEVDPAAAVRWNSLPACRLGRIVR